MCLKTGDYGKDGEPFYRDDPDALGRIFVGPYLAFEPELSLILEDDQGVCGYAFGALDSRAFYARYESEWRPQLVRAVPAAAGRPGHLDAGTDRPFLVSSPRLLLPRSLTRRIRRTCTSICCERAQGRGFGRRMMEQVMDTLRRRGSPGGASGREHAQHAGAWAFTSRLGFRELHPRRHGDGRLHLSGQRRSRTRH